jgi:hypothetical protein
MARVEINNNGKSGFLWVDIWGNEILMHKFPELFSFNNKKHIIMPKGMAQTPLHNLFHLPPSQQAHGQMLQLQNILEGVSLNESTDRWLYIWNTGQFSVKRAYNHLSGHLILHPVYN